jgi:tRNA G18 (ribose-2'-O)-methylase SpoU
VSPRRTPGRPLRGYYGVAVYRPKIGANVAMLWRSASVYGAAFLATVGHRYQRHCADTPNSPLHTPLHHYADLEDLIAHLPHSCPLIGVELDGRAAPLDTYTHPDRALYLLGAEDDGLPPAVLDRCHQIVQIPTPVAHSLNVAVAGGLVMAHRYWTATTAVMGAGSLHRSSTATPKGEAV